MKTLLSLSLAVLSAGLLAQGKPAPKAKETIQSPAPADAKKQQDLACIKSMAGIYKVSFNFAETFAADTGYKYHKRYNEWGIEYVFVAEESDNKVALQHLLLVNDSIIIKHWRQDWVFENTDVYQYYKDNEWMKKTLSPGQAKGTWTQKVYQVDDSPRYESYGTWVHVDGRHYWQGVNDSPLPRREYTKRSDYNVLRRHSHIELLPDGWVLNQDNEKVVRANGIDKTICWEKGIERFSKGSYDATPAIKWWTKQENYWADVRKAWGEVYLASADLKLEKTVADKRLYEALFDLGDDACKQGNYMQGKAVPEIKKVITAFVAAEGSQNAKKDL